MTIDIEQVLKAFQSIGIKNPNIEDVTHFFHELGVHFDWKMEPIAEQYLNTYGVYKGQAKGKQQLFIPNYKIWNNVREKHKYHAFNYNEQTMNTATQNTEAAKPIRSMYISVEEYSRVVDGLGTQLQLQSRMTDHLGDQLTLSREQINNQSEYIQQLKAEAVENESTLKRCGDAINSYANKKAELDKQVTALKAQVQYYKSKCKK